MDCFEALASCGLAIAAALIGFVIGFEWAYGNSLKDQSTALDEQNARFDKAMAGVLESHRKERKEHEESTESLIQERAADARLSRAVHRELIDDNNRKWENDAIIHGAAKYDQQLTRDGLKVRFVWLTPPIG